MKSRLALALAISCLCVSVSVHAVGVSGQGTLQSTLKGRDLDGNLTTAEAYYDTELGVMWVAEANYSGIQMNWVVANNWASNPNYNGINGWLLPSVMPIDGTTADDLNLSYISTEDYGYNISAPGTTYAGSTCVLFVRG